ncbi:MAG: pro-sigmaK processing inhibitor BofA family protein [Oscillospiraceae bacterium]|nr:pro-sigmaK processing inhibitor BofA family protein [Oscillospiraceae bacterium]
MTGTAWFGLVLFVLGVILFVSYSRTGKMLRCIAFTAVSGPVALGLLWMLGNFAQIGVALTPVSLLTAAILGIPGVVGMLLLMTF